LPDSAYGARHSLPKLQKIAYRSSITFFTRRELSFSEKFPLQGIPNPPAQVEPDSMDNSRAAKLRLITGELA